MTSPAQFTDPGERLSDLSQQALEARTAARNATRVLVQWGHCSQAVGADLIYRRLAEALAGQPDVSLVATGCDGACFAATQVVVQRPDGADSYFDHLGPDDDLAGVLAASRGARRCGDLTSIAGIGSLLQSSAPCGSGRIGQHRPSFVGRIRGWRWLQRVGDGVVPVPRCNMRAGAEAGLLGRGGAFFPAARKWQAARSVNARRRHVVVNAEEGEPGVFKDRHLMEGNPHRIIEGALIAAHAAGADSVVIYVNAEANLSAERMSRAVADATTANLIGDNILGVGWGCTVTVRRGAGGYVCGEETTLLNTIEGRRREPRLRPPFPTDAGLYGEPTVINNAETLCNVPAILTGGVRRFASIGLNDARGTRLVSLSGAVRRPGMAEVPMGTTVLQVIELVGGGVAGGRPMGFAAVGGPSSGILPAAELNVPLRPGMLHASGVVMGAGGITVFDDQASPVDVTARLAAYNAAESCGKCTPCREGTPRIAAALQRMAAGELAPTDVSDLQDLAEIVGAASLCGLGQMAGNPVSSLLHFYGDRLVDA